MGRNESRKAVTLQIILVSAFFTFLYVWTVCVFIYWLIIDMCLLVYLNVVAFDNICDYVCLLWHVSLFFFHSVFSYICV